MSTLILPVGYTREDRDRLMVEAMHDMALLERFAWNPQFAYDVMKLHASRLMTPGTASHCVQCMERVAVREQRA